MKKQIYIEIMDRAFQAYTEEQISDFYNRVKENGLTEHGFPRLTSNLGVLICHGRHTELLPLFVDMMDLCCEQIPRVHAANDFSVREVVTCLLAVEKAEIVSPEKITEWRSAIASIDPWKCYDCVAKHRDQLIGNWSLFNSASEYARIYGGLVEESAVEEYASIQIATQLRLVDELGMYMDPHNVQPAYQGYTYPVLYDYVARVLFAFLIHHGYHGEHRDEIVAALEKSADLTLKMQSVTGEIPFGGRSAQFMHNECTEAALLEFYASHFASKGDLGRAAQFKRAAQLAAENVLYWLDAAPMKHVKNRYSIESKVGCEAYAYFDKYMITAASMAYMAYLFSDDEIAEAERCPAVEGGYVAQTSRCFHKYFLNKCGYFVEIDSDADKHYEGSGIGRIQKLGAPPQICLSAGFSSHTSFIIDGKNSCNLSLCASAEIDGKWYIGADGKYTVDLVEAREGECAAELACTVEDKRISEKITVSESGVKIVASAVADKVALEVPAFSFDGLEKTNIEINDKELTVEYRGYVCRYTTSGHFVDLGEDVCNRNGRYHRYRAVDEDLVHVKIEIEKL